MNTLPGTIEKCYDCGSTIPNSHTKLCAFRSKGDAVLPSIKGTQYWNKKKPMYDFGCKKCYRLWKQTNPTRKFCNRCGSPKVVNLTLSKKMTKK